jgi:hypothetical protein
MDSRNANPDVDALAFDLGGSVEKAGSGIRGYAKQFWGRQL